MAAPTTAAPEVEPPRFELRHRLARALEWGGISREQMAVQIGVGVTTVRNYLSGRTLPTRAAVEVWAQRCGVPVDWLLNGDGMPTETPQARRGSVGSGWASRIPALAAAS